MPEFAGDAALYFDPYNPQSLATRLCEVLDDPRLSVELGRRSRERSAEFQWKQSAEATWQALSDLAGGPRTTDRMCGIAGFVGRFDQDCLGEMSQAFAYRGPDDSGEWFDPAAAVGLCHRRLSIIDVSPLGHQPMWEASGRLAIVFNGEIYNYPELRKELLGSGLPFASQTDTEVLLNCISGMARRCFPVSMACSRLPSGTDRSVALPRPRCPRRQAALLRANL